MAQCILGDAGAAELPPVATLLKPQVLSRVVQDREVMTHASLEELSKGKLYSFYAAMLVRAPLKRVSTIMQDYPLYAKMIPYVDRSSFDEKTSLLSLEGGIFGFKLRSLVRFEEKGERFLRYRIAGGHFTGLSGRLIFEPQGENGTLVFWQGSQEAAEFPPKFVIERGAEIVFGAIGSRMRSYIEQPEHKDAHDANSQIPQPRGHL